MCHYPIALDNNYATWNAYKNNYWPAEYLIDATGTVRHVDFGEGQYDQTESFIRQLLVAANPSVHLPAPTDVANLTPDEADHPRVVPGLPARHPQPGRRDAWRRTRWPPTRHPRTSRPTSTPTAASGPSARRPRRLGPGPPSTWPSRPRTSTWSSGASGTVQVSVNGKPTKTVTVGGEPKLYQLVGSGASEQALLSLAVSPGVQAYDFTFG